MRAFTATNMHKPALPCMPSTTYLKTQTGFIPKGALWIQWQGRGSTWGASGMAAQAPLLPCQLQTKALSCWLFTSSLSNHQLRTLPAVAGSTSCFLALFCGQGYPFPSMLPKLLQPEASPSWRRSHLMGSCVAAALCKTLSRGRVLVCISTGDEQTHCPSASIWGFPRGDSTARISF